METMNKKVMWIDDDVPIIEAMKNFPWEKYYCQFVGSATNGKDAVSLLDALEPDFVFLDITMPIMDGLEFLKIAKPRHPDTDFIIYSAFCEFEYAREAIRLGAKDYIAKGELTDEELGSYLLKMMGRKESREEETAGTYRYEVQYVIDELGKHFTEQVSMDQNASVLGLSVNYLGSLFFKETGMHFKDYLTKLRMERANQLLRFTPLKVFEVAEQVGIPNVQYFITLFTKYYGVTPGQVK